VKYQRIRTSMVGKQSAKDENPNKKKEVASSPVKERGQ
jgi:hypothetical protein